MALSHGRCVVSGPKSDRHGAKPGDIFIGVSFTSILTKHGEHVMNVLVVKRFIAAHFIVAFFCTPALGATVSEPVVNSNQNPPIPAVQRPNIPLAVQSADKLNSVDLGITITGPAQGYVGATISYSVTVKNNSATQTATGVKVVIPNTGTLKISEVSSTGSMAGHSISDVAVEITINSIAAGATAAVTLKGQSFQIAPATIAATVSSALLDPNRSNNSASTTTLVIRSEQPTGPRGVNPPGR